MAPHGRRSAVRRSLVTKVWHSDGRRPWPIRRFIEKPSNLLTHLGRGERPIVTPWGSHRRTTVASQGWLAGPKPSLDADREVASLDRDPQVARLCARTVAATALGSASSAATFEVKPDYYPDIMVINGEIKEGDGINFIRALVSSPTPIKLLRLNSLGGEMVAGKVIAAMTRTMMLNTLVGDKDTCASMCVLIFAAGTKRMHFSTGRDRRAFAWQLLPKTSTSRSRTTVPRPTTPTSPASSSATVRPTVSLAR